MQVHGEKACERVEHVVSLNIHIVGFLAEVFEWPRHHHVTLVNAKSAVSSVMPYQCERLTHTPSFTFQHPSSKLCQNQLHF